MNGILEKLQSVHVQNRTRLSMEDQRFCQMQQKLYDGTRNHFLSMFIDMEVLHKQELTFYSQIKEYKERVYRQELICMDKKMQKEIMEKIHNHFIKTIVTFFNRKYGISMQIYSYERYISIQKPIEPVLRGRIVSLTEDELQDYREKMDIYRKQKEKMNFEIIFFRMEYRLILDDIFSYLGGFSFQEKLEQEIKSNSKSGFTYATCKLQSKTISIKNLVYSKTDYSGEWEIMLDSEKYKAVLRALSFYDSGREQIEIYEVWKERYISFSYSGKKEKDGIFGEHQIFGKKVFKFKYFKNGRWDIIFDSGVHALEFAKEYLGYKGAA